MQPLEAMTDEKRMDGPWLCVFGRLEEALNINVLEHNATPKSTIKP